MSQQGRTQTIQSLLGSKRVPKLISHKTTLKKRVRKMDRFLAPLNVFSKGMGTESGASFFPKSLNCQVFGEAIGFWRWSNFLHSQVAAGKKPLHVNLDETGIRLHQMAGKGLLVTAAVQEKRKAASLTQNVSRAMLRGSFTHVTMICDDMEAQKLLPQILIVNKHMVTEHQHQELFAMMPPNVLLIRRNTAWMTSDLMTRVLIVLKHNLAPFMETHQILLSADAYRAHVTNEVWKQCVKQQILYCVIPAKLTWALQPCDTHVFASYKHRLQTLCQGAVVDTESGKLSLEVLLKAVCQCVIQVLEGRSWSRAFADTGLTGSQEHVSARVQSKLSFDHVPAVGSDLPTLAQLVNVFPKRAILPIDDMFGMFLPSTSIAGRHVRPIATNVDDAAEPDDMHPGPLTRSRTASRIALLATLSAEPCPGPRPRQLWLLPRLVRLPRRPAPTEQAEMPPCSPTSASGMASSSSGMQSHD
jgi:hypothetical protein